LWTGRYFRLYTDPDNFRHSDGCFVDQLAGQALAWLFDLGDLYPAEQSISALRAITGLNVRSTAWGAIRSVKPEGLPDDSAGHLSDGISCCETWSFALAALMAANRFDRPELREAALGAAQRQYSALIQGGGLWRQPTLIDSKDAHPLSGSHDVESLLFWALPF